MNPYLALVDLNGRFFGGREVGQFNFFLETEIPEIPLIERLLPQYATAHLFSSGPSLLLQPGTIS